MKKIITESNQILCVVHDKVAENFGAPTLFINENVAKRSFADLLSTDIYKLHSGDYELVKIGLYSSKDGIVSPCNHTILIRGVDIVKE